MVFPGYAFKFVPQGSGCCVGEMVQQVIGEFPPAELAQKGLGTSKNGSVCFPFGLVLQGMPDDPGAHFPEMQMRGEPGTSTEVRAITVPLIIQYSLVQEMGELLLRSAFAGRPGIPEAGRPVNCGFQLQFVYWYRGGKLAWARKAGRDREWLIGSSPRQASLPEWSKYLIGLSGLVPHRGGIKKP